MRHTPGPWTYDEFGDATIRADNWGVIVAKGPKRMHHDQEHQADANMRLITASPDLLESCKKLISVIADVYDWASPLDLACTEVKSAIAKAEGK